MKTIAVIDIGTNSIKLLVANKLTPLHTAVRGTRIGQGIGKEGFLISEEALARNVQAISELFAEAHRFHPEKTVIVGTSAIRDALNADLFRQKIKAETGIEVQTLSGEEEATLIAKGVATDPNLTGINEFSLFDLGGGSLECIHYKDKTILSAISLPLGIVRLTEQFIKNPKKPIPQQELQQVIDFIKKEIGHFPIKNIPLIATGGALSTTRSALNKGPLLTKTDLEQFMQTLSSITMQERIEKFNIPPYRADLMPTALAIILAIISKTNANEIIHSHYNLRYGIVSELFK